MEINKVQWRMIAKRAKLPCDSFLMKKDGTMTSMVTGAGVTVGQDAYYLPVEELRSFPKEESEDDRMIQYFKDLAPFDKAEELYEKYGFSHNDAIDWLEKQAEQKPTEEYNITGIGSKHAQGKLGEMIKKLKPVNEVLEQKHWSEEDEVLCRQIEGILSVCRTKSLLSFDLYKKMLDLLNSLKDRVQPQPKQEWSEEDEYHKRQILRILKANGCSQTLQERTEKWIEERLKSIRPQSHWKPSDEQMNALEYYMHTLVCNEHKEILFGLYTDLKKLKA